MTMPKTKTVAIRLVTLGRLVRVNASRRARSYGTMNEWKYKKRKYDSITLSERVASRWNSAMTAPSNSVPRPVLMVVGLNA